MKKLMFAAAAAFCGTVFALESANIVGYQNLSVNHGKTLSTPTFYSVNGGSVNIQDIVPAGENVPDGSGETVSFYFLDANSQLDGSVYYWQNREIQPPLAFLPKFTVYGWYTKANPSNADDGKANITIPAGKAFYMSSPTACFLTVSGQVPNGDVNVAVNAGKTLVGNPLPSDISIQDITPVGENVPNGSDSAISFYFLDSTSQLDGSVYYWQNREIQPPLAFLPKFTVYGWYTKANPSNADDGKASLDVTSGKGFYVTSPTEVQFNFKGLDL